MQFDELDLNVKESQIAGPNSSTGTSQAVFDEPNNSAHRSRTSESMIPE